MIVTPRHPVSQQEKCPFVKRPHWDVMWTQSNLMHGVSSGSSHGSRPWPCMGNVDHRVVFHGSGLLRRSLGPVPGLCSPATNTVAPVCNPDVQAPSILSSSPRHLMTRCASVALWRPPATT